MLTLARIKETVAKVGGEYGIKNAYLFGSYAKNTADENSDVDLIIDKGEVHTFRDFFHLQKDLEEALGTDVDLLTGKSVTSSFFEKIRNDRILLYGA